MKTFAVVAALLLAACEPRVDTPTADDLKLVLRPESLKTGKPIDARAVHCDVMPPLLAYHRVKCVYFDSSVERDYLESDAEAGFAAIKDAWTMLHLRPADELLSVGDHHYAAYVMDGDTPRGNGFIVRKGTIVLRVLVSGTVINDPNAVRALLEPLVDEAARQDRA